MDQILPECSSRGGGKSVGNRQVSKLHISMKHRATYVEAAKSYALYENRYVRHGLDEAAELELVFSWHRKELPVERARKETSSNSLAVGGND